MLEKRADQVTFQDVQEFCTQAIPESRWLDYKQDYTDSKSGNYAVAKIMSAMANTHGGWVLYGIKEKRDTQGRGIPDTITGIKASLKLADRIKQICLDAVYPPLVPEIGTCDMGGGKELVILRIYESDSTPHQLSDGKVYIRPNDISYPAIDGQDALVEEIELLLNRREKSIKLKESLIERANQRLRLNPAVPQLQLTCIPTFPHNPICNYKEMTDAASGARVFFAFNQSVSLHTAHGSVYDNFERCGIAGNQGRRALFEFSVYGLSYYNTQISTDKQPSNAQYGIQANAAVSLLYSWLQAVDYYYQAVRFSGLVDVVMALQMEGGSALLVDSGIVTHTSRVPDPIRDRYFCIERRAYSHQLLETEFIAGIYREFLWSAGYGPSISDEPRQAVEQLNQAQSFGQTKLDPPLTQ